LHDAYESCERSLPLRVSGGPAEGVRASGCAIVGIAAFAAGLVVGCATPPGDRVAPGPERAWAVPNAATYSAVARANGEVGRPPPHGGGAAVVDPVKAYELAEVIDIAERTNPETRVAWERAREAAFGLGIAEGVHEPMLSAKAAAAFQRIPLPLPKTTLTPQGFFIADTRAFLPALTLKWLLFDFGGKEASIDAATQTLAAANFGFNAMHQKIVFDVTRTYYALSAAQGRVEVARVAQGQSQVVQDATESRRARGLATLPEVLQARERSAHAVYELEAATAGEVDARMGLLEAMGIAPTTALRIAGVARRPSPPLLEATAEALIERALAQRPDLMARVAVVRAREADVRKAESEFYPKIVVSGDVGQNIGRVRTTDIPGWARVNDLTYGAAVFIEVPLFDGNLRRNRLGLAKSELRIAEDELELQRDRAARQVVKAYEELKVALRQREAATALLAAAQQSYDAAIDSYRRGVATFVDITNAQTALIKARTADTDATSLLHTATAALAFSTGDLAPTIPELAVGGGDRPR
jgi:outer membrane protein